MKEMQKFFIWIRNGCGGVGRGRGGGSGAIIYK
jgi:hypothetical protein